MMNPENNRLKRGRSREVLFKDFGKVVVRSPLYSYRRLFDGQDKTLDPDAVVLEMLDDPVFLEGLYWSSPQLYQTVLEFKQGNARASRQNKLMHTLKKYAIRASTRCTPFGVYAGCAVAGIGECVDSGSGDSGSGDSGATGDRSGVRKVRIDMGMLQQLIKQMESDPTLWVHLRYQLNNSCYSLSGQYRFIESVIEDGKFQYQISSVEQTALLEQVIERVQQKTMVTIADVFSLMDKDTSYNEAVQFTKELIDTQLLVSELQLGLTIENELERIRAILERLVSKGVAEANRYLDLFRCMIRSLGAFDRLPMGTLPLEEIKKLKQLLPGAGIGAEDCHLFHADLRQPVPEAFVFPASVIDDLEAAITILSKLTPAGSPHETQLDRFKKKFLEKYETLEIPLAEALDPEFGIGFPAMDSIGNVAQNSSAEKMHLTLKTNPGKKATDCHGWLQDKAECFSPGGSEEGIRLEGRDFEKFEDKVDQLSSHFIVMGTLLASGKILLQSVGGAHSTMLLGRFAHLEKKMSDFCQELAEAEAEENEAVIFAEIIHIPEGRTGNIARRQLLSGYEIPFLASSAVDAGKQLPIGDLMVSVIKNEIVIRSKKWNKRIIPRLSNAHNYLNSTLSIYKFLAAIQHQGKLSVEVNWGTATQHKRYFPRVSYRNFILHRATWVLQENDIQAIVQSEDPLAGLKHLLSAWQVTRFVCFCEGDKELFIDTNNDAYLQILLEEIKAAAQVRLVEWLHGDMPFIQQFILPLAKTKPVPVRPFAKAVDNTLQRVFEPGSEWIYYKIFCGAKVSDSVLSKVVKPAIDLLSEDEVISKAFFIRYTDPHYHIRFRLQLSDPANGQQFSAAIRHVSNLLHPLLSDRTVWKVQLDTYQRELERYGAGAMLISEEAFSHDSRLFLSCLEDEAFEEDQELRFLTAVKNTDKWLSLFNLSLDERIDFCDDMAGAFAREFGRDVKRQVDLQYRDWKKPIAHFLNGSKFDLVFGEREKSLKELALPIENISSYIHMSMNRWFATEQRLMEYMSYHFCGKYYNQLVHQTNGSQ